MGRQIKMSGKTVDEAVWSGLNELGLSIDEIEVEIIQKGSSGLLGIGAKPAIVLITEKDSEHIDVKSLFEKEEPKKPRPERREHKAGEHRKTHSAERQPRTAQPAPTAQQEQQPVEQQAETTEQLTQQVTLPAEIAEPSEEIQYSAEYAQKNEAAKFLSELLRRMQIEATVLAADHEGGLRLKIETESAGVLIGHRGETLDALQYLTLLVANRDRSQNEYTRVTIDTQGYREKRQEVLVRLAKSKASAVRATGRAYRFEPMSPYERRIIHSTLQTNPNVTTHSEGLEPHRYVVITSTRNPRRHRRYNNHHADRTSEQQ